MLNTAQEKIKKHALPFFQALLKVLHTVLQKLFLSDNSVQRNVFNMLVTEFSLQLDESSHSHSHSPPSWSSEDAKSKVYP